VVIALLGLFALGVSVLNGAAVAASLAVLLVLAASMTLLPALLTVTGRRVGRPRPRRGRAQPARVGFWGRWAGLIQRRAVWAAVGSTALLLVLAAPALGLRLGASDAGNDPAKLTTRRAYDLLANGFGRGFNGPLLVAVRLPRANDTATLTRLTSALRQASGVASVATPQLNRTHNTAAIRVYPTTSPESSQTTSLVKRLRNQVLPPIASSTGATVFVGGVTAAQVDFAHVLASKLPLFIGVVFVLSALLLLVVFRSLLIPLQAMLMNLLSFGAALGVIQAIFERGWLAGPIGVQKGPIDAFVPVLVFAIVFGLSMDYEVFLVSRIHEEWQRLRDPSAAVNEGVARTGRVITAAATVMIAVFISFALGDVRALKLFGVSMAAAVFLDAFVIRSILLPAVFELSGDLTWRFPNGLGRLLPRLAIELPAQPEVPINEPLQPVTLADFDPR
jgi:RND superfamily putative drug exporter